MTSSSSKALSRQRLMISEVETIAVGRPCLHVGTLVHRGVMCDASPTLAIRIQRHGTTVIKAAMPDQHITTMQEHPARSGTTTLDLLLDQRRQLFLSPTWPVWIALVQPERRQNQMATQPRPPMAPGHNLERPAVRCDVLQRDPGCCVPAIDVRRSVTPATRPRGPGRRGLMN